MIERIEHQGAEMAIILRAVEPESGIRFHTPPHYSQQLASMRHPAGHVIQPHVHLPVPRAVAFTQETLFLRRGRLRVDLYTDDHQYLESRELGPGDVILLIRGGHGFEVLEEVDMVEVKQGPYVGEADKSRFTGITGSEARTLPAGASEE